MRLVFQEIPKNINFDSIEKFKNKELTITNLYSEEGLFRIQNDKLFKINIIDNDFNKYSINDIDFLLDKSDIHLKLFNYKIPFNFESKKMVQIIYSLNNNSKIQLVIEHVNQKLHDVYFTTNYDIANYSIKEDICTFLSLLK